MKVEGEGWGGGEGGVWGWGQGQFEGFSIAPVVALAAAMNSV